MSLAVIVHGKASFDMVKNARYGVAFEGVDLLPNVEMALSAMTAHALLQQDGYTLNPF